MASSGHLPPIRLERHTPPHALRVALDTSYAGVNQTGVGKYSRRLTEALEELRREGELELSCFGPSCAQPGSARPLGGLYQEWPTYTQLFLPLALRRTAPDVVHSTSHIGPLWGSGRRIVTVHDLIFLRSPRDYAPTWLRLTRLLLPVVLTGAAAIVTDSNATKTDVEHFFPGRGSKATTIYPGADPAFSAPVAKAEVEATRVEFGLGTDPYILALGPWVRRKNLGTVIAAFGRLGERFETLRLVVTGKPASGMQAEDIASKVKQLPATVRKRVHTVGHVPWERMPSLMNGATALAYPSLFEGFGLPPLEAMAAGVPVVASDTPAVVEACGHAALIVPSRDPRQWAEALSTIIEDPQVAASLRERGLKRASEFTWRRCALEAVDLYRSVARRL